MGKLFPRFNAKKKEGKLVIPAPSREEAPMKTPEAVVKPVEEYTTIYKWKKCSDSYCCPNCDAEIKNNMKYCKACGWGS